MIVENAGDAALVLVGDDDPTVRFLTREALEQVGFRVAEASGGLETLDGVASSAPEVVLLDVNMPDLDGYAVCSELRRRRYDLPIVMITASDDTESIRRAYEAGATDFIPKPIHWGLLGYRVQYVRRASRTLEELRRSERKNRALLEAIPDVMVRVAQDGALQEYRQGKGPALRRAPPASPNILADVMPPSLAEITAAGVRRCLQTGRPDDVECTVELDGEQRGYEVRVVPTGSGDALAILRDVTWERNLERQLREAQRLEALGTLTGGIAHDFNNLLTPMIGYAEMALQVAPAGERMERCMRKVLGAAERARELVKQIAAFSRQEEANREPVLLSSLVEEVLGLMRGSTPDDVEIVQSPTSGRDTVLADPAQLQRVILNLCTNAAHAMRGRPGVLEAHVGAFDVSDGNRPHPDLRPGPYVRLSVSDTGHGMPAEVQERIFEPFFTTKGPGEGTGIGLAASHGIVRAHGGTITVESEPGRGSRFDVYLPAAEGSPAEPAAASVRGGPCSGRVLVVDDEEMVTAVAVETLRDLGYTVESVAEGAEALRKFRAEPTNYDVVVTDMTMPHMSGTELARELLAIRPDLPVLLCSGLAAPPIRRDAEAIGVRGFLSKPWSRAEFGLAVNRLVGTTANELR